MSVRVYKKKRNHNEQHALKTYCSAATDTVVVLTKNICRETNTNTHTHKNIDITCQNYAQQQSQQKKSLKLGVFQEPRQVHADISQERTVYTRCADKRTASYLQNLTAKSLLLLSLTVSQSAGKELLKSYCTWRQRERQRGAAQLSICSIKQTPI